LKGDYLGKSVTLACAYFENCFEKNDLSKLSISLQNFEILQQSSLNGIDPTLYGALECHQAFISLIKAIILKFRNAFPIFLTKYEKNKQFVGITQFLSPIFDEIKAKYLN
jgi:hypothetical protein